MGPQVEEIVWVPAERSLPDHGRDVLCWAEPECFCGWYDAKNGCFVDSTGREMEDGAVTHWAVPNGPART